MDAVTENGPAGDAGRPRPAWHFTPRSGWINDPHGIVHVDGRYHLFFQYNPSGTAWDAAVNWGHATSADLIHWDEQPVALAPAADEIGCWSGSVVLSDRGVPTLFYTRIVAGDSALGQIARAVGDPALRSWRRDPQEPVIAGLPADVVEFRDPSVWRAPDGWRMLVGGRLRGDVGAVLQYRSDDLGDWAYDGIVAERPSTETDGVWTGSMWECPHLFPLDGTWVLLVSVLHDGRLNAVAYALGDYDGQRFTPRIWGEFSRGDRMYATTSFVDAEGRRCVVSWLREGPAGPPAGSPWAGALSVPWVLRVQGERLVAEPHPNVGAAVTVDGNGVVSIGDLEVRVGPEAVVVTGDGTELLRMPGGEKVHLVVDTDLVELAVDGVSGIGATRWPSACAAAPVVKSGTAARITPVCRIEVL